MPAGAGEQVLGEITGDHAAPGAGEYQVAFDAQQQLPPGLLPGLGADLERFQGQHVPPPRGLGVGGVGAGQALIEQAAGAQPDADEQERDREDVGQPREVVGHLTAVAAGDLDETASGRLVEGIHALMAEFYSANLAAEVRKGMGQKAKLGGYPHMAPLGYVNVREPIGGRQVAHIVPDPERAPLVRAAFELYATGEWTVERLAEEMAHRGLRNRGRDGHYPAKAVTVSGFARLLGHRAYVGIVEWDGIEYDGQHEPLVERATFEKVQELLAARAMRGTRERQHHHYLKGVLVCGVCGRRLSIQYSKGAYTYRYCLGQKDRRNGTGRQERYVAADQLEAEVEDLYGRIEVPADWSEGLPEAIAAEVASHHEDTAAERELLAHRRGHAEAERFKLMEAYYANAIDVTMLRREQERIGAELRAIESRQAVLDASLDDWQEVMDLALRFSTRCANAYRRSGDRTRRLFNAAVLDEVHVRNGHIVEAAYKEPFDLLFAVPKFEYDDVVGPVGFEPTLSSS